MYSVKSHKRNLRRESIRTTLPTSNSCRLNENMYSKEKLFHTGFKKLNNPMFWGLRVKLVVTNNRPKGIKSFFSLYYP